MATAEGAAGIIATAVDTYGAAHGVVNNAGILRDGSLVKMFDEAREELFQRKGVSFGEVPTLAAVAERWSEATDMRGAVPGTNPVV